MESVAKDFPAQSILNEMGGYVAKAKKVKTTKSQVKYLNLSRKALENGIGERVHGFERLESSHKAVVAELNRIQELVGDKERFDRPAGGETEYLKAEHSKAEHLAYLLELRDSGIPEVGLLSMRDANVCDECAVADGVKMAIDVAIETQPLPHRDCGPHGCRCTYDPIMPPD